MKMLVGERGCESQPLVPNLGAWSRFCCRSII
jgi:hypothetical protein